MTKADGKRGVTILGSTGSIGRNTVQLIQANQDCYHVHALVAGRNVSLLVQQALDLRPDMVVVADSQCYAAVKQALNGSGIAVAAGPDAVVEAACLPANWVMAAIVGAAGLPPTLAAIRRGAVIGLANKECLVCAGSLLMDEVKRHGATFIPVDSEHSAIFQVFETAQRQRIEKIILTASGGPFRTHTLAQMAGVTPAQAVAHPNWSMGAKISVDSASMMNKGLELIEAHHLFNMPEEQIDILVHPQSVIHSMVSYADGSVLAQLGSPDMRTPIAYALGWPDRMSSPAPKLDLAAIGQLTFESPDESRFPALRLARQVLHMGPAAPTVLNAANEIAVQAFLEGRVGFLDIARIVEQVLAGMETDTLVDIEGVFQQDRWAREKALALISAAAF